MGTVETWWNELPPLHTPTLDAILRFEVEDIERDDDLGISLKAYNPLVHRPNVRHQQPRVNEHDAVLDELLQVARDTEYAYNPFVRHVVAHSTPRVQDAVPVSG